MAVVVTRLQAGAGGVALRGALAVDPEGYDVTIIAGGTDGAADADGSGDRLLGHAADAGLRVVHVPGLVSPISPRRDIRALRLLTEHLLGAGYDVVHTHSAKAGALGRLAAERAGTPRVVHTFHGFPVPRVPVPRPPGRLRRIERYLARRTDVFLAVGGAVAAEAVRRGIAVPDRVRVINPAISWPASPSGPAARAIGPPQLAVPVGCSVVGHGGPGRLPEGPGIIRGCHGRAGPARRVRGLDRRRPAAP